MLDAAKTLKAAVDFPQEGERISSSHYTFRIRAPLNAEKVEVCIDGSPWQLCRYSASFWWYDWSGYSAGEHELVARILPFDSRNHLLKTRRFVVDPNGARPATSVRRMTQFSIMTASSELPLVRLAELLSEEGVDISAIMTVSTGDSVAIQFLVE